MKRPKWKPGDRVLHLIDRRRDWWVPVTVAEVKQIDGRWVVKLAELGVCVDPETLKDPD